MKKKLLISSLMSMLVASTLLFPQQSEVAAAAAGNSQASTKTKIMLDGYPLEFAAEPVIVQGSTMVPFRGIAEALNIEVLWNAKSKTVTANQATAEGKKVVVLQLNQKKAKISGKEVELAAAPFSRAGTTYIPLSFFSKQFGAQVSWDQKSRVVALQSPPKKMYSLAFYALKSFGERQYIPQFDSVAFGWARLQDDGTITTSGSEYNWPQAAGDITPESILDKAKQDGTSPYLMVFSTDRKNELTKMLEDAALRDKAIEDIMKLVADKGFSGIVLDFEGLGLSGDIEKAKRDYNEFVIGLSKQAKAANIKLSLALHPLNGAYKGYDYKTLSTAADDLIIMAYEYTRGKVPEPLDKVNEAIKLALKEVPKEKLILGISTWSENEKTISSVIGLAKRYQLKGTALWRLGLIGEASKAQIDKNVIPLKS
ncbi:stalk domain-containing protein [Paenibacillus alvei]|uniref:stalk domain-containing protein n=1 Tax=Paenibacillus alvei TaxID=44250 RepID=UPI000289EA8B|nr:stalk domain-containing protein [Paenibacillus alvei]EJW19837.1 copper amine oxidase domain-containing protein [Paenibacillus alvei DSM 29]MCY9543536.1 stalk domain-containing protein [Paenibacillus alvei]MCY9706879.1 stalk domain-containing protein [Paenibacillus alvei]MCY9737637.1 stalk domain-containing protein [Paenibacillus alvei]MCY9755624.1 stalk domain-containing protein [Paenibacillus alvei]